MKNFRIIFFRIIAILFIITYLINYTQFSSSFYWIPDIYQSIRWDDDDENLWDWPTAFISWTGWVKELYLISWDGKKRTFFRRSVILDPKAPSTATCDITATWSWCLWTIEFLKLDWKDWWIDHSKSWTWAYDGIVDTWTVDPLFTWWSEVIAWSWNYRQKMFSDDINVKSFKIYPYPNKNRKYAWKDFSNTTNISPYVRIELILTPSWKKRSAIKWTPPDIKIATTINLVDYFSK